MIEPDQKVVFGQLFPPVAPDGAAPVVFQVAQPVGGFYQRRPFPDGGVAYADTIGGRTESDLLFRRFLTSVLRFERRKFGGKVWVEQLEYLFRTLHVLEAVHTYVPQLHAFRQGILY